MKVLDAFRLDGKVAVVTGGARTLGYDVADALAEAGAEVAITSRSVKRAEAAAQELRAKWNRDVMAYELDVCDHGAVTVFATAVRDWKGRVDVLVNNAGGGLGLAPTNLFDRKPEHMRQLIETNLLGALFCCQAFGKIMAAQGSGSIINIASIAGMVGRDRRMYRQTGLAEQPVDYAAAKAGVIGMTRDLAGFLSPMGVRVNAISPGGFERGQPRAFVRAYSDETPLGRMGTDGVDLKGAAVFLASSASGYVTGHNLVVDGGFSMWK